jgi:hypothetical protein
LNTSAEAQFGADFLICDLETLKGAVHSTLEKMEKPVSSSGPSRGADGGERFAYLICGEKDRKATIPLRKLLKVQGLDVQIPVFEGDSGVVRQNHQDLLAQCDAVIIFYGAGDESWKRTVDSDLRKIKGYRGEKPLSAVYTYLAPPATSDKEDLIEMEEPNLVNGLAGFSEPDLQPLLQTLKPDLNAQARGA